MEWKFKRKDGQNCYCSGRTFKFYPDYDVVQSEIDWTGDPEKSVAIYLEDGQVGYLDKILFEYMYDIGKSPDFMEFGKIEMPFTKAQFNDYIKLLKDRYRYPYGSDDMAINYLLISNFLMPTKGFFPGHRNEMFSTLYTIYGENIPLQWDTIKYLVECEILDVKDQFTFCQPKIEKSYHSDIFMNGLLAKYPMMKDSDLYKRYGFSKTDYNLERLLYSIF